MDTKEKLEEIVKEELSSEEVSEKNQKGQNDLPQEDKISQENIVDEKTPENYEKKIQELDESVKQFKDSFLRERAAFINYRKRTAQENIQLEEIVVSKIMHSIFPALDAFEQLFAISLEGNIINNHHSVNKFIEGAKMIRKQFMDAFEKYGVTEYDPEGEPFNPQEMEALHVKESDDTKVSKVNTVYQKGYKLKDKLLRPARVAVIKPKEKEKKDVKSKE